MRRLQMNLRVVLAAAAIALLIATASFRPAQGQAVAGPLVTVDNTSANPVPIKGTATVTGSVAITGTPNVNVANTPAVNAQQSGPWSVGINGTPSVNVASMPAVTIGGTPNVNITGGTINASQAPVSNDEEVFEAALDPHGFRQYFFNTSGLATTTEVQFAVGLDTSTLIINTANDLDDVVLNYCKLCADGNTILGAISLGHISGGGSPIVLVFNQPIRFTEVLVHNPADFTKATFTMSFLGDNLH